MGWGVGLGKSNKDKQGERGVPNFVHFMNTNLIHLIEWSHLFCSPIYHKAVTGFLLLPSVTYQGHTNKQLVSLADSYITHWLELF